MRTSRTLRLSAIALVTVSASAGGAEADELRLHVSAGAAHAVGGPQQSEFGAGGGGAVAGEVPIRKVLGVELELSALTLAAGNAASPKAASPAIGVGLGGMVGVRVRPFGATTVAGLYVDGHAGVTYTGNVARPGMDAQIGYDWRLGGAGRWDVGPFVGFTEIVETSSAVVPGAARVLWLGAQIALGAPERRVAPKAPIEPVVEIERPLPPSDRDHDDVADADDACPDVPGRRTSDPTTNGCPRVDRDNDTVFDDEDACPDVPGFRTASPATNGCPAPRNEVRLAGSLIVLGDIIHFEIDSPRVRSVSWPLVKNVAEFLKANPDIRQIDVQGHADETGPDNYNQSLSQERAEAVKRLLLKYGLGEDRVTTRAFGESQPRAPGHTPESLRQNRRVEFVVTRATARSDELSTASSDQHQSAFTSGEHQ